MIVCGAQETLEHGHGILRSQPTADIKKIFTKKLNKSSHNSLNFAIVYISEANAQLMEKLMFEIKRTISKFATHMFVKKYMKLKRINLMNPTTRAIMNFFLLKLLIFRTPHILTKSRIKTDCSITLPLDGIPVSYIIYTGAQCNIIPLKIFKEFDPEPNLCLVNI